jgi:hypothetical protein
MTKFYIDDSIHERGNFIISGIVITDEEIDALISESLLKNEFNPETDEFKSGLSYRRYPKMINVRQDIKNIIRNHCKIGLVILPSSERANIGIETLKGLKQIIESNDFEQDFEVFIDENYFRNADTGIKLAKEINLNNGKLNLEVDSKLVKGIQLADLVAHTCSTMMLEKLGLVTKQVKVGENSGYDDPDMEVEIGFELWADLRYCFLGKLDEEKLNNGDEPPINKTEPFGLYISELCNEELATNTRQRFGEIYLGCIH